MLRRTQSIVFDNEIRTNPAEDKPAEEDGAERRRHPRLSLAEASGPESTTDRRQGDRRQGDRRRIESLRNEFQYTSNTKSNGAGSKFRPSLRPSRIFLLVVALGSGGLAAYMANNNQTPAAQPMVETQTQMVAEPRVQVLVANQPIAVGQRLSEASLGWAEWPQDAVLGDYITSELAPEAVSEMGDAIARIELLPGEPIREQKLLRTSQGMLSAFLDEGMRAVSVSVTADSAAGGFINPNDRVDVVLTRATPRGEVSETVLSNVRVLAINARLGDSPPDEAPAPEMFGGMAIATLALDPVQSEVIIAGASAGRLSLVLRAVTDFDESLLHSERAANQAIRLTSPFWQAGFNGRSE